MSDIAATPIAPTSTRGALSSLLRAVVRHRLATVGLTIIALMCLMAVFASLLAPYNPYDQDLYAVLSPPSAAHWLGTDNLGRDVLSRVIYGARVSLLVGIVSTALSSAIGVVAGLVAGFKGGAADAIIMRVTDAFLCFPPLIFILAMAAALGPGIYNVIISFAVFGWTGFARIMRGQVLLVRELPFVEASRAAGVSPFGLMWRHILPNALTPIIVAVSVTVGAAILVEAGVSFLGLGVQPPTASWGAELRIGFTYLETAPLFSIAPGLMVSLAVIAFNFVGDGLRDALDPRLQGTDRRR